MAVHRQALRAALGGLWTWVWLVSSPPSTSSGARHAVQVGLGLHNMLGAWLDQVMLH